MNQKNLLDISYVQGMLLDNGQGLKNRVNSRPVGFQIFTVHTGTQKCIPPTPSPVANGCLSRSPISWWAWVLSCSPCIKKQGISNQSWTTKYSGEISISVSLFFWQNQNGKIILLMKNVKWNHQKVGFLQIFFTRYKSIWPAEVSQ